MPPRPAPIPVNTGTTFTPHPGNQGFTVNHAAGNGSQIVVNTQAPRTGQPPHVVAYKQTHDPVTGAQTRTYLDGRRVTTGTDFVTRAEPRQLTVTTHRNGLRDVALPDGRPVYRERFGDYSWRGGRKERVIVRTVLASIALGAAVALGQPVDLIYGIMPYRGVTIYPYVPDAFAPAYYDAFMTPFASPMMVGYDCPYCPPPSVDFGAPAYGYADPMDLVGDLVLAGAMQDGMTGYDLAAPQAPDPEVAELSIEVAALRQQIQTAAVSNQQLQSQLAAQQGQLAALDQRTAAPPPPPKTPVQIAPDVRKQIHQQVREDIALHQEKKPLTLADVIASAEARDYIFQIGDMIDATDTAQGEECPLTTGDLVKFDAVPAEGEPAARMRVVTSKTGSCHAGSTVNVSLTDLQEMLNAFSLRLEESMKKVHDQVASAAPAPRAD